MNFLALLLPNHRASVSAFVLGVIILMALDALRLTYGTAPVPGIVPLFAIWFVCHSLFANRRRHAGRGTGLAILPLVLAILAKGVGALVGFGMQVFEAMLQFAEEQGLDTSDQVAFSEALADPGFQPAFQAWLEADQERLMAMVQAGAWPSFIGFWMVLGVFAIWFATLQRNGTSADQT
ncbi:hypothetical protein [Maricaulis sp.]|uniref:hypothetical protein n=1 Tax=Maricaulis sp. TaxID=1486257 RepID=UPI002B26F9FB|nr:hypothetical protein [Maricaulis sp.]